MEMMKTMKTEVKKELLEGIIPFWQRLKDTEYGGYYGWLSYDLTLDKEAVKGCILNSRITWFFANAYLLFKDGFLTDDELAKVGYTGADLLEHAKWGYDFLKEKCIDKKNGGVYWSLRYDGTPEDTTKHTYNQAFSIYALSSYYDASKDEEALTLAYDLYEIIESNCRDEGGYLEAFTLDFKPESNEKLSENGVLADRTMNTLLHVFEAYTEFYRVTKDEQIKEKLLWMSDVFEKHMYEPHLHRQEVFFDLNYKSLIDLHSYGHDIETAWLLDRGIALVNEPVYSEKISKITRDLTENIYKVAFDGASLANECERGMVDENRVWWVQAEAVVGFVNGYEQGVGQEKYLEAAGAIWNFIKTKVIDKREGSEWYWLVKKDGTPVEGKPIVEPWKCPYHNGRMCFEVIRRLS